MNAEELALYLAAPRLRCLECGRSYSFLAPHLRRAHDLDAVTYRQRWQIPAGTPLASLEYRLAGRVRLAGLIRDGRVTPNPGAASEAARGKPRQPRTAWQRDEQAARMRANAPRPSRPDDARHANGRHAGRAREYLRAWRALQRGDPSLMARYRQTYPR